ncbi:hypothetical protein [Streptomyces sp. NPDC086787]|uniref:hypothetical protein n=1 Tax=Streptomyces sp. NPDC086787 TaxID=3365759 RepID=UPI0038076F59
MRTLARWARAEWGPLHVIVRHALTERRLRAVPMALGAVCLTAALQFTQNQSWGYQFVQHTGAVRADDPLWLALLRTPLSLFVPALDLPVWGALVQLLLVFGIAEICLGRWRTLAIAYVATLAGTLYARAAIALGPHTPLGLPTTDAHVVDTGPSAAVVGLALYLAHRYGARVTGAGVIAAMVAEVLVKNNLAGKEHLAAIAGVAALCGAQSLLSGRGNRGSRGPGRTAPAASGGAPASGGGTGGRLGAGAGSGSRPGPGRGSRSARSGARSAGRGTRSAGRGSRSASGAGSASPPVRV